MDNFRLFRHEDVVKYTSEKYLDEKWNPLWGGIYGLVKGTVRGNPLYRWTDDCCITVRWENGESNTYAHEDLELVDKKVVKWIDDEDFEL